MPVCNGRAIFSGTVHLSCPHSCPHSCPASLPSSRTRRFQGDVCAGRRGEVAQKGWLNFLRSSTPSGLRSSSQLPLSLSPPNSAPPPNRLPLRQYSCSLCPSAHRSARPSVWLSAHLSAQPSGCAGGSRCTWSMGVCGPLLVRDLSSSGGGSVGVYCGGGCVCLSLCSLPTRFVWACRAVLVST